MTTIRLLEELKKDLSLLNCFDSQIEAIKASHLAEIKALQPKPKRVIAKKPKERPLKCEITEAGKTTVVIFQTSKECDAFLKLKHKHRLTTAQNPEGLYPPTWQSNNNSNSVYAKKSAEYWQAAKDQNLDFNVIISRP